MKDQDENYKDEEQDEEDYKQEEPSFEPECPQDGTGGIECEFENRDGSWWCTTHHCWA